jgi:GT2 family glycosyltransferase
MDYLTSVNFQLGHTNIPWILFWTGHVSVPTAAVKSVGGFDEWFHSWGGEDVELGLRLFQMGCSFELLRTVESLHYPHSKDAIKKQIDSQKNVQYIHQKHQLESTRLLCTMNWEQLIQIKF